MSRFNLRRKPRISYYEVEEPNLDEYVYCDECTDFVYEYCAIHGPLLVVPDKKVTSRAGIPPWVPRAALTTPKEFVHIAPSYMPGAGLGVFSTLTLPRGVRFGPYQGIRMAEVKSTYCWQIKSPDLKHNTVVDAGDGETSNWLRYVNCSRNWREQNLVAFQYQGQIYYRTIKIIPRFTELLVFYGSEFASALGVDLRRYNAPPAAQYGALPTKKPAFTTKKQEEKRERPPVTDENQNKVDKDAERGNIRSTSDSKDTAAKKPKGKKIQKRVEKPRPDRTQVTRQHQNKLVHGDDKDDSVADHKGTGVPPIKKRRAAKKQQEKSQSAPAAIANQNNITKEVENEANIAFNSNKVEKLIEIYSCRLCGKSFEEKSLLNVHIKCHNSDLNIYFDCEVCDYRNVTRDSLEKHMRVHDVQKPFQCNICEWRFAAKFCLESHLRTHTGEKPYVCNVCDKRFTHSVNLERHLRTHSGEKPYVCNVCDKRFTQSGHLESHLRTHSGEKPYVCNVCDKRFTQSVNLERHLRTHSGEKPYVCNVCDKRFTQSGHLESHLRTHSGEKPYVCNICDKRFTQSSDLKTHLRIHSGEKPYVCNVCDKRFTISGNLKTHLRMHSGEKPYVCNVCDKRFTQSTTLKTHLRIHSGEKPYVCNVCDKRFTQSTTLKTHLRIHSGEIPYVCNVCDKRFTKSGNLKVHLKTHNGEAM